MFQFLSVFFGLSIDQLKYLLCMILSFPVAVILRDVFSYKTTSVRIRNAYTAVFGILFCVVCFDWNTIYLIVYTAICYGMLHYIRRDVVQWYTLGFCITFVCSSHIYRMIVSYGENYKLDIITPLMVMTQRLTYVSFSYHDGGRKDEKLTEDQKQNSITTMPSLIEYLSYVFSFYSVLTGPTASYMQHNDMITGRNIERHLTKGEKLPSNLLVVIRKTLIGVVFLLFIMIAGSLNLDKKILDNQESVPLYIRLILINVYCCTMRFTLMFIWMTVEGVSNLAGLGFNGFDEHGEPKWDLVTNIKIFACEFGPIQDKIKYVNCLTAKWLKRIIYERFSSYGYWITFGISLIWHGFYPGQFLFYFCVLLGVEATKKIRHNIRPYLSSSQLLRFLYKVFSTIGVYIYANFAHSAFVFLQYDMVYTVWKYYYFTPLIAGIAIVVLLPSPQLAAKKNN